MTLIRRLSLSATVATLIQIGSGGLVRATGSGDGCPDWPRCFGRWVPPLEYHALIEYSHRFIALIAMGLVLAAMAVAITRHRSERRLLLPAVVSGLAIIGMAGIGAAVVRSGLHEGIVTAHIGLAMVLVASVVTLAVNARCLTRAGSKIIVEPGTRFLAALAAGFVLIAILAGADVRGSGAGLVFSDWPLMDGRLIPSLGGNAGRHFAHRLAVLLAGIALAAFVVRAHRARPRDAAVVIFARVAGALFLVQALVGAAQIWTTLDAWAVASHVLLSALVWASLVAAVGVTRRLAPAEQPGAPRRARPEPLPISGAQVLEAPAPVHAVVRSRLDVARGYLMLTKPRIVLLLVITTVPTMLLAGNGSLDAWLAFATVFGGALGAGAANAINMVIDRDIDAVMRRTRARPLPAHVVTPPRALAFGIALAAVSFAFMATTVNVLAALLTQSAIAFYVFVYTMALKRTTPQNIVIGGAAGAVPVLVGWAAVTGTVGLEAWVLFAVIFAWTPPHFWALAMRHAKDYEAAGVPMLPVVAGPRATQRQIVAYAVVTVALSLALVPVAPMGPLYAVCAAVLGARLTAHSVALYMSGTPREAMRLFRSSIGYLGLLFAAVAADAIVRGL